MGIYGVPARLEEIHGEVETYEVEPPMSFEREFAASLVCKFLYKRLFVSNFRFREFGKSCTLACLVQISEGTRNVPLLTESLRIHEDDIRISEHREIIADLGSELCVVSVHPLGYGIQRIVDFRVCIDKVQAVVFCAVDGLEFRSRILDVSENVGGGTVPISVTVIVAFVVIEGEDDFLVHLVGNVEDLSRSCHKAISRVGQELSVPQDISRM